MEIKEEPLPCFGSIPEKEKDFEIELEPLDFTCDDEVLTNLKLQVKFAKIYQDLLVLYRELSDLLEGFQLREIERATTMEMEIFTDCYVIVATPKNINENTIEEELAKVIEELDMISPFIISIYQGKKNEEIARKLGW